MPITNDSVYTALIFENCLLSEVHSSSYLYRASIVSEHFFIVPNDGHYYKYHRMLKQFKIITLAPTNMRCVIPVVLSNNNNKLMIHMYIVKNTTIFLIVRLLFIRYNYMFRLSTLAIFRLYMKHLTISYIYTWEGGFTSCGMGWVRDLVLCL